RPWRKNRSVLNGILWILRTGAPWADLPDRYPSYQTCHRRFQYSVRSGLLRSVLEILAPALHDEGYLDLHEAFMDESFAPGQHGGAAVGKTKRGKGSKIPKPMVMIIGGCSRRSTYGGHCGTVPRREMAAVMTARAGSCRMSVWTAPRCSDR